MRYTGNVRIVVVFGMGESFGSIWTHNEPWLACISVAHAQHTANVYIRIRSMDISTKKQRLARSE